MTNCSCCGGPTCQCGAATALLNRPGQAAIAWRAGTHASFLAAMKRRLSDQRYAQLAALQRRDSGDPAIALLDAWAVSADVLTFYAERIANENYLRTATERRSVLELARLTGYRLRPGVAASVYLAYELEDKALPLTLPIGTRAQSIPGPGESMQTFETAEVLEARVEWNALRPRQSQPQVRDTDSLLSAGIYLQGTATQLKPNDPLLVSLNGADPAALRIESVTVDADAGRTHVRLRGWDAVAKPVNPLQAAPLTDFVSKLTAPPKPQPVNALHLPRSKEQAFTSGADVYPQLLQQLFPILRANLYPLLVNAPLSKAVPIRVFALRARAALFAHNAPNQPVFSKPIPEPPGIAISVTNVIEPTIATTWGSLVPEVAAPLPRIALDRVYDQVKAGAESYAVIDRPAFSNANKLQVPGRVGVHRIDAIAAVTMATPIGAALDVTQLGLNLKGGAHIDGAWLGDLKDTDQQTPLSAALSSTDLLRGTRVYAQSEELAVADEPLTEPLCNGDEDHEIELDALYDGLKPGRWVAVSGERSDVTGVDHIDGAELAMLAAVRHGLKQVTVGGVAQNLPGDKLHTFVTLFDSLGSCYKRADVTLNANVVRATHGETRREAAGGGDPTQALQQFTLKQAPLTYVAAPTPSGVASTLSMWVNDVRWPEVASLAELAPSQRGYISRRDNDEVTSVTFGDGVHGARLPGGADNVRALYRSGIGKGGNVRAGQIALATDKPLGVKAVQNPMRASGGAGPDTLEQARVNAPLAVMALDRLVSLRDYADFSRMFAGIGKAGAQLSAGARGQAVEVTIAGVEDIPIDPGSDLYRNLLAALRAFGDPHTAVKLRVRDALALTIHAGVALQDNYAWDSVAPAVRDALNAAFGFAAVELGQDIYVSAVVGVIQKVPGVAWSRVTVEILRPVQLVAGLFETGGGTVPGSKPAAMAAGPCAGARIPVAATEIAYLAPEVPDTLILELL
jgi:hypothetical protein